MFVLNFGIMYLFKFFSFSWKTSANIKMKLFSKEFCKGILGMFEYVQKIVWESKFWILKGLLLKLQTSKGHQVKKRQTNKQREGKREKEGRKEGRKEKEKKGLGSQWKKNEKNQGQSDLLGGRSFDRPEKKFQTAHLATWHNTPRAK